MSRGEVSAGYTPARQAWCHENFVTKPDARHENPPVTKTRRNGKILRARNEKPAESATSASRRTMPAHGLRKPGNRPPLLGEFCPGKIRETSVCVVRQALRLDVRSASRSTPPPQKTSPQKLFPLAWRPCAAWGLSRRTDGGASRCQCTAPRTKPSA